MEKFKNIEYIRPDYSNIKKELKKLTLAIKKAESYDEYKNLYFEISKLNEQVFTQSSICHVRNTLNVNDSYYDNENRINNEEISKFSLDLLKTNKVLLASEFRKQFDEEFGDFTNKSIEATLRLISRKTLQDEIEENNLTQKYAKDSALCKTKFKGKECNFYGLLKYMQSTDRQVRKKAFVAWSNLYESVSDKLDDTYTKLVNNRVRQAKKLGFNNYIEMAYLNRKRFDYSIEDVANFREAVRKYIVPVCVELREKQRQRLEIDKLHYYDESLLFKEGNALPMGNKDELLNKASKMYKEMSKETDEFFSFMMEYDLFDLDTKVGKRMGGYTTFFPACYVMTNVK